MKVLYQVLYNNLSILAFTRPSAAYGYACLIAENPMETLPLHLKPTDTLKYLDYGCLNERKDFYKLLERTQPHNLYVDVASIWFLSPQGNISHNVSVQRVITLTDRDAVSELYKYPESFEEAIKAAC